jgi:hypothetical protein
MSLTVAGSRSDAVAYEGAAKSCGATTLWASLRPAYPDGEQTFVAVDGPPEIVECLLGWLKRHPELKLIPRDPRDKGQDVF